MVKQKRLVTPVIVSKVLKKFYHTEEKNAMVYDEKFLIAEARTKELESIHGRLVEITHDLDRQNFYTVDLHKLNAALAGVITKLYVDLGRQENPLQEMPALNNIHFELVGAFTSIAIATVHLDNLCGENSKIPALAETAKVALKNLLTEIEHQLEEDEKIE